MFRRLATFLPVLASAPRRFYTPSPELKELYASNFDTAQYPVYITPSDSVLFAKFLYKAVEPKQNFDVVLKDFQAIAAAMPKLPVFWERTCQVKDIEEFKVLSEPTFFTLEWMQSNGMLDLLPDVASAYEAYANAKLKRVIAKIYVAPGKAEDAELIAQAKQLGESMLKDLKEFAGFELTPKVLVDRSIEEGFAVELQGSYVNKAKGRKVEKHVEDESDYTTIPVPHLPPTKWEDNVETEVMRAYLESLARYDAEELVNGV